LQFNVEVLGESVTLGVDLSSVISTVEVAVHPLADVAVTEYEPAALTVIEEVEAPFDQLRLPLLVAVSVISGTRQVITPAVGLTESVGGVLSSVIATLAVAVHPKALVAVTEYIPDSFAVI
jgi:hypothetical protein